MQTITNRQDAETYVIDSIKGSGVVEDARAEYDVEAILDHWWDAYTGWAALEAADGEDEFWTVVEQYAR